MKASYIMIVLILLFSLALAACASGVVVKPRGEVVVGGSASGSTAR